MLDPEELEEIRRLEAQGVARATPLAGDVVITGGALWPILTFSGVVLAAIVAGLGRWPAALAIAGVIIAAWVFGRRRVRKLRVDARGQLFLGSAMSPVAWNDVQEITFAVRLPLGAAERDRMHFSVVDVTITEGLTRHAFARGQLFTVPARQPITFDVLSAFLRENAERSGMRVVVRAPLDWVASR